MITNNQGERIGHACDMSRSISYYLECIIPLSYMGKEKLELYISGITNDNIDTPIESWSTLYSSLLPMFNLQPPNIEIITRGVYPKGEGEIHLTLCPVAHIAGGVEMLDQGKVKRIRGVAYISKANTSILTTLVDNARDVFNHFIPDVWIATHIIKAPAHKMYIYTIYTYI